MTLSTSITNPLNTLFAVAQRAMKTAWTIFKNAAVDFKWVKPHPASTCPMSKPAQLSLYYTAWITKIKGSGERALKLYSFAAL